jgi:hypothetical protein
LILKLPPHHKIARINHAIKVVVAGQIAGQQLA